MLLAVAKGQLLFSDDQQCGNPHSFLTDSILRIRAGFDGDFAEESYSLVMTAWEDRMDDFLKGRRTRVEAADAVLSDGDRRR